MQSQFKTVLARFAGLGVAAKIVLAAGVAVASAGGAAGVVALEHVATHHSVQTPNDNPAPVVVTDSSTPGAGDGTDAGDETSSPEPSATEGTDANNDNQGNEGDTADESTPSAAPTQTAGDDDNQGDDNNQGSDDQGDGSDPSTSAPTVAPSTGSGGDDQGDGGGSSNSD